MYFNDLSRLEEGHVLRSKVTSRKFARLVLHFALIMRSLASMMVMMSSRTLCNCLDFSLNTVEVKFTEPTIFVDC